MAGDRLPADLQLIREQLAALAADESALRDDLLELTRAILDAERAAMEAVRRGDDIAARRHLDAMEAQRTEAGLVEAEIRVVAATLASYREAFEALERRLEPGK